MPGFVVLAAVCVGRWCIPVAARPPDDEEGRAGDRWSVVGLRWSFAAFVIAHVGLYASAGLQTRNMGSIAEARGRTERFQGANGIDVAVNRYEKLLMDSVVRVSEKYTDAGDAVLCFPYCPGLIVLADRTTFVRDLYVDDSFLISRPSWQQRMIEQMKAEKPKLVIRDSRAVNRTEISRFENWATDVMDYIESEYVRVGRLGVYYFYARRDATAKRP
jgi:hypothetical protein